jgi:prepilin-type N-terminal cleavage/methylation domain-containing protein
MMMASGSSFPASPPTACFSIAARALRRRGFSLIELLITLAVVAVLSGVVVPVAQTAIQRGKEQDLRIALRELREAIDHYKKAGDEGRIRKTMTDTGYPKKLEILVEGEEGSARPQAIARSTSCAGFPAIRCIRMPAYRRPTPGPNEPTPARPTIPAKATTSTTSIRNPALSA